MVIPINFDHTKFILPDHQPGTYLSARFVWTCLRGANKQIHLDEQRPGRKSTVNHGI